MLSSDHLRILWVAAFALLSGFAIACTESATDVSGSGGDGSVDGDSDGDTDGDADGDSDGDADGDADGDSDGDADGDTDGDADGDSDASVCETLLVVGDGLNGMMDDLEREPAQLQAYPNPAQQDGRNGSWTWYPETATVEIVDDAGDSVLHFAGSSLAAWAGVSLAFLGADGGNACYDGSEYTGLQFDIKGTATSTDELDGIVIVSIVTAETQTTAYGGDLVGTGGHFNFHVTLTSDWQTIQIPWTTFNPPTWGDTASLTTVATGKLQAVDWGISNLASAFDVNIDDIQLY